MGREIEAAIVRCWKCEIPLQVVDGKTTTTVTFWMKMGQSVATPHADDCEFRGKEMPDRPLGLSSDSDRPAPPPASRRGSTTTTGNIPGLVEDEKKARGRTRKGFWG